ncbi:MAG: DNA gyrase subunit A [Deltaproteobacteria bacterium]|nr:DNA gyrase subunit A [Deltaproteobacteria bacterium]
MTESLGKISVAIEDELRDSYLDYAMSVIIGRAIPDARDGLKPVHRRILFAMHEMKLNWNQAYRKSARVVGEVLGKYHPHGDSAVYDALVRMAQDFSLRYPLIDGQGNFGSVDGDSPAAMRYTETRMARLASELLADIDKETVEYSPNFDDSEREPVVLPSRVPNLLINGSGGIAVGMATNVAPHNLSEVVDATIRLIKNPDLTIDELMAPDAETGSAGLQGPDFPTAGLIYGAAGIRQAFHTGRGRVVVRARAELEPMPGAKEREQIVVTELPYQVNKAELLKKIAALVREKRIEGISDLRDETDRSGMRIVFELKRSVAGQIVLNQLYQMTQLQTTFGVNNLAIVGGRPKVLSIKEMLMCFIEHRRDVVTRRSRFELREAQVQREVVEGLGTAISQVDLVIQTIRSSSDADEARQALMRLALTGLEEFVRRAGRPESEIEQARARNLYYLSERQARAILDMRLARLTGLEQEKLAFEYAELCDKIARLLRILNDERELVSVIVTELGEIRERYGDQRRTEIVEVEGEISVEDLVADEDVVVTISHTGYIKRVPITEYRAQSRGGRGKLAMDTRDEDFLEQIFVANNHAHVLFLSDKGQAYLKKVYEIPESSRTARGRAIVNLVGMESGDRIASIVPIREFSDEFDLITCTKRGLVKRSSLSAYAAIRVTGIIGVALAPEDELLAADVARENEQIMIGTSQGKSIRFNVADVRRMGRDSRGVRGIELREGDSVVGMCIVRSDDVQVLSISENGYGKRTPLNEWKVQGRSGIGIIAMDASERNGAMVKLSLVKMDDQVVVITDGGQLIRIRVAQIREAGRNTQGVRIIRLTDGERVVDVAPIAERDEEENGDIVGSEQ